MASVHDEDARDILVRLGNVEFQAGSFWTQFAKLMPGSWKAQAFLAGYSDPQQHVRIAVARCLHDAMPAPFCDIPFDWTQDYGIRIVDAYTRSATPDQLTVLVNKALHECNRVLVGG